MKSTRMHWLTDKKAALFVQYVTQRSPELKDVPTLAARYNIRSIPTLMVFKGGREIARQAGAMPAPA